MFLVEWDTQTSFFLDVPRLTSIMGARCSESTSFAWAIVLSTESKDSMYGSFLIQRIFYLVAPPQCPLIYRKFLYNYYSESTQFSLLFLTSNYLGPDYSQESEGRRHQHHPCDPFLGSFLAPPSCAYPPRLYGPAQQQNHTTLHS
jgi:hypothetical protein